MDTEEEQDEEEEEDDEDEYVRNLIWIYIFFPRKWNSSKKQLRETGNVAKTRTMNAFITENLKDMKYTNKTIYIFIYITIFV